MRFNEVVKSIRIRKKNLYGKAFTQEACGSRMNPPVGQAGWSRYEVDDRQFEYDTVRQIAIALQIPDEETEDFFKAAGYDLRNDLRLPIEVKNGNLLPLEITEDREKQIQALKQQALSLAALADELLKK